MNVPSARYGRKDIIRVEGLELRRSETDRLALLGPHVTVAIVKGGKVAEKQRLEVPERLVGVLRCTNPTCITNHERIVPVFDRVSVSPLALKCAYCERFLAE
jgi:aspartate carbamoyltransferase regulatory subunit